MQEITDGSATFRVINKKLQTIFDLLYPLSSIYISGADNGIPPGKNEGLATWEELPADKVLQTASGGAGGMIEAGLPNITGKTWLRPISTGGGIVWDNQSGALMSKVVEDANDASGSITFNGAKYPFGSISIDASKSNNIYGKSNTVQPPAYKIRAWIRIK